MTTNHGFLVKYDRFSLTDPDLYYLSGWLVPGTTLSAVLDGRELPVELLTVTENTDERYGGCETKATVHLPVELAPGKKLRLYATSDSGRRLVFAIKTEELIEKKNAIRCFIDEFTVNRTDGYVRLTGWAIAKEPVSIEVYGKDGYSYTNRVERSKRADTVALFEEYPVDPDNGFFMEIRPIPEEEFRVELKSGEDSLTLTYPTGSAAVKLGRVSQILRKSRDVLSYNGIPALAAKAYNKLFNPAMRTVSYGNWIRKHLPSQRVLALQRNDRLEREPLISIVVPCYKTPGKYLRELVSTILGQSYLNWELILSDGSGEDSPIADLLTQVAREDVRIRVVQNNRQMPIPENTNAAIAAAKGEWIAFCDHDDLLVQSALYECMKLWNAHPEGELIYTDEDKIDASGKYMQPNFKPDFDPDFLRSVNYICHFTMIRRTLLDRIGLLDSSMNGAQDYDLMLRASEATKGILHVPKILYHWRFFEGSTAANPESKWYAFEAGKRAIEAHYKRLGLPASVEFGEYPGLYRTTYHWTEQPLISVLIPNKDHLSDLRKCLTSLSGKVAYPNLEILIIENNSTEQETFAGYEELKRSDPRIRVITYEGGFNYSAINNFAERHANGELLLLLNNDTEFITDAVTEMAGYCLRSDVGAVGARLYYGDDTIQHAGAIIGWGGVAGHAFVNQKRGLSGYQHRIICQQDYSAVTAACMMVKRSVFREVGGFTEELAVAFNDIDLCMKIREKGYLIVYNPFAELYHYESKSRGLENTPEKKSRFIHELRTFQKKWPEILRDGDPYYNPNLSMITQDFSLKRN